MVRNAGKHLALEVAGKLVQVHEQADVINIGSSIRSLLHYKAISPIFSDEITSAV